MNNRVNHCDVYALRVESKPRARRNMHDNYTRSANAMRIQRPANEENVPQHYTVRGSKPINQ